MIARHKYAVLLSLVVSLLAAGGADARGRGHRTSVDPALIANALPCVMTDFSVMTPAATIYDPTTGETVTAAKTIWVQYGVNSGFWAGEPTFGSLLVLQLFVDDTLTTALDFSGGTVSPLRWNSPTLGQHELTLRLYVANYFKTKSCYVDSAPQYPVVVQ